MAGLLGDGFEDPRSAAMMALAGGLLQGNFGGGLLGANDAYAQAKQGAIKQKLLEAQIAETMAQADERKNKLLMAQQAQVRQDAFLNGDANGVSPGAFTPSLGGMGPVMPPGAAPQAGGLIGRARALGIPEDAIKSDVLFNGGKKIAEFIEKHGAPDMQVSNGYLYDKNRQGAGFLPQLSTSQSGQTSMIQIGPDGLPVVSAPTGAQNTYAGYRNIDESAKANFDPVTVTPKGQPPQMTTRGALVTNPQVQGRMVSPDQQAAMDRDRQQILTQEMTKAKAQLNAALSAGDQSAAARAQTDIASLEREMGGRRPTVGMPLQSEEEKLRAQKGVEADSARNVAVTGDVQKSKDTLSNIQQARQLLSQRPTSSGLGSAVDSTANFFGTSTKGADVAAQLDTLSGWMVNNVPRMEGPQSNFDVQNYKTMAAMVGDRTKPLSQRLKALDTLETLQNKYSGLNSGGNTINAGGATGGWENSGKQSTFSSGGWSATLKK